MYADNTLADSINGQYYLDFSISSYNEGLYYLAYLELKTAEFLAMSNLIVAKYKDKFLSSIDEPLNMEENKHYYYMILKNELIKRANSEYFAVLDISGGGDNLHFYVPSTRCFLVDPIVKETSRLDVPFRDDTFDYVVSC